MTRGPFPALAFAALALSLLVAGCATHGARLDELPRATLTTSQGGALALDDEVRRHELTVIFFFSDHCPCQAAHDARLRDLYARYAPRGVGFVGVASEVSMDEASVAAAAKARAYPFPLLLDRGAAFAEAVGAGYATYTLVVDRAGRVRYRGGIDSDRSHLEDDASPYVAWALDDLLARRPPRRTEAEVLGCALQKS